MPIRQNRSSFTILSSKEILDKSRRQKYYLNHVFTESGTTYEGLG